jgi:hypothetical protein
VDELQKLTGALGCQRCKPVLRAPTPAPDHYTIDNAHRGAQKMSSKHVPNDQPYVYIQSSLSGNYGHLFARFRLPVGPYRRMIEFTLRSQQGAYERDMDPHDFYGMRFEVPGLELDDFDEVAAYKKKLDRFLVRVPAELQSKARWFGMLSAALDAWKIDHGHVFQGERDHRAIEDTPHFAGLKGAGRATMFLAIDEMFRREVAAKLPYEGRKAA